MTESLRVKAETSEYVIRIGRSLLGAIQTELGELLRGKKVHLVTDKSVYALYGEKLELALQKTALSVGTTLLAAGEEHKSLSTTQQLYSDFLKTGITRSDYVIALGGGVVGDLAGFAASSYLRGVPIIHIPTTLLAQVDSSVGGKVAVNLPEGKNLVGSFFQPSLVLIDPNTLETLDQRLFSEGMAEVIKYAAIADSELFSLLESSSPEEIKRHLPAVILRCCTIKADIVEKDPRDKGERMLLNFGHTVGHAIEEAAGYGCYYHGEAISIGMVVAARLGEAVGITQAGSAERIESLLKKYHLPVGLEKPLNMIPSMKRDKKIMGSAVYFVLLNKIGEARVCPIEWESLVIQLEEFVNGYAQHRQ